MPGVRDAHALESCVRQPQTEVYDTERFPTAYDKASAYCYFIVRLHPFLDGNKRTGVLSGHTFLHRNGVTPRYDSERMYAAVGAVIEGTSGINELARVFAGKQ